MLGEPLDSYLDDFDQIVHVTYYSVRACPFKSDVGWCNALHAYIMEIISKFGEVLPLSKKEIRQELFAMWVQFSKEFEENKPKIHLRQYLLRRSIWALRDWISGQCNQQFLPLTFAPGATQEDMTPDFGFILDYKFLVYGTGWYPLCLLSPYERYLVFLKFVEEKSIVEISYIVQKDRLTVKKQLDEIIEDFRSKLNVHQTAKSTGHCDPGPGVQGQEFDSRTSTTGD